MQLCYQLPTPHNDTMPKIPRFSPIRRA